MNSVSCEQRVEQSDRVALEVAEAVALEEVAEAVPKELDRRVLVRLLPVGIPVLPAMVVPLPTGKGGTVLLAELPLVAALPEELLAGM